jgi:hypothetical protein
MNMQKNLQAQRVPKDFNGVEIRRGKPVFP